MKRILQIGHNDLRLFLRIKASYLWLFVIPLAFVFFMGYANRGPSAPATPRPKVALENLDRGFLGGVLVQELGTQGLQVVGPKRRAEAERGIRIPADFTERVQRREPVKIQFFRVAGSGTQEAALVQMRLLRAVIALNSYLLELVGDSTNQVQFTAPALQRVMAETNAVTLKTGFAGRRPVPAGFNQSVPGTLTMYLLLNLLIFGGASVAQERRGGVLRRIAVHPISRLELVMGKVYGRFLLGLAQIAVLLGAGRYLFHLDIGTNLPALLVVLGLYAWMAASLGVLIGGWLQDQDKIVGLCILSSLLLSAIGGCWWPMEITPHFMQVFGSCFPTAWTMEALHRLINFGDGFRTVLPQVGLLFLLAVGANFAAARLLRY